MQSGASAPTAATTPTPSAAASTPLGVAPKDLLAAFATVPDPRRRQGTRFALPAVLALTVAAMLSNHLSVLAVAEWGAHQSQTLLQALGFAEGVTPHQSTLQRLFRTRSTPTRSRKP